MSKKKKTDNVTPKSSKLLRVTGEWVRVPKGKTLTTITEGIEVLIGKDPSVDLFENREISVLRAYFGKFTLNEFAYYRCNNSGATIYIGDNSFDTIGSSLSKDPGGVGLTNPLTENLDGGGFEILNYVNNNTRPYQGEAIWNIDSGNINESIIEGAELNLLTDFVYSATPVLSNSFAHANSEFKDDQNNIVNDVFSSTNVLLPNPSNSTENIFLTASTVITAVITGSVSGFISSGQIQIGLQDVNDPSNIKWDARGFPVFSDGDFENIRFELGESIDFSNYLCNGNGGTILIKNTASGTINITKAIIRIGYRVI